MGAVFVSEGDTIDHTPSGDVSSGDVIVQGSLIGIAKTDIAANALGALAVAGVFELPCGEAITAGAQVYWDGSDVTATSTDNDLGKAVAASYNGDSLVRVRLSQ